MEVIVPFPSKSKPRKAARAKSLRSSMLWSMMAAKNSVYAMVPGKGNWKPLTSGAAKMQRNEKKNGDLTLSPSSLIGCVQCPNDTVQTCTNLNIMIEWFNPSSFTLCIKHLYSLGHPLMPRTWGCRSKGQILHEVRQRHFALMMNIYFLENTSELFMFIGP